MITVEDRKVGYMYRVEPHNAEDSGWSRRAGAHRAHLPGKNMQPLESFHARLNHVDVVPGEWYRRNHAQYPLVCYVNNIMGLYLSGRFDAIPIFLRRATEHMTASSNAIKREPYCVLVEAYLRHMARFLYSLDALHKSQKDIIPAELLNEGEPPL